MESHNCYSNGTYLFPQKRGWMWLGANWRGTDGVWGGWAGVAEGFLGSVKAGSANQHQSH